VASKNYFMKALTFFKALTSSLGLILAIRVRYFLKPLSLWKRLHFFLVLKTLTFC